MSYVRFPCGCERDDETVSHVHVKGPQQSAADRERKLHHYPQGREPARWCISHRGERPCDCDRAKTTKPKAKQPKSNHAAQHKRKKR